MTMAQESIGNAIDPLDGIFIRGFGIAIEVRVDDDQQPTTRMIERHKRIGQHVKRFRQATG